MTTISVIIPLHDHADTVCATIESVLAQESVPDIGVEIVVVDDLSTDGGPDRVRTTFAAQVAAGTLQVLQHATRRRAAAARNTGYAACSGELLLFLDSDDLLPPDRFANQVAALRANPQAGAAGGMIAEFASDGWRGRPPVAEPISSRMAAALLIRREAYETIGAFDETLEAREVVEWGTRLLRSDVVVADVPHVVLHRRLHGANHGLAHRNTAELLNTARAHLLARRTDEAGPTCNS